MNIYLSVFAALLLAHFLSLRLPGWRRLLYYFFLFFLTVFSAFRFEVGCDWAGYLNNYRTQYDNDIAFATSHYEPLWWLMLEGLIRLDMPYPWINVITSGIFFAGLHALARRQPDPFGFLVLSFPILILNMPMSAIRQGMAIGILAFALLAFVDRKTVRFVLLVLLAGSIHASAILFLLLTPFAGGELTRNRVFIAFLLTLSGAFMLLQTQGIEAGITRYTTSEITAAGAMARTGLLLLTGLLFLLVLRPRWRMYFPKDYKLVLLGSLAMVAVPALIPLSTVIADRLGYYLLHMQLIILNRIPWLRLVTFRRLLSVAPYLVYMLVLVIWTTQSHLFQTCYLPYDNWLSEFLQEGFAWQPDLE